MVLGRSSYVTRAHEFVEQPIQFSHLHHVLDDGIDCRVLSHVGRNVIVCRNSAHKDVHQLSLAAVQHRADSRARPRQLSRRQAAVVDTRPRLAGLRLLQSQHPREEGRRLRDLSRSRRRDAADGSGAVAPDGMVSRLSPCAGEIRSATERDHDHGLPPFGAAVVARPAARQGIRYSVAHQLLDVPSVIRS